MIEGCRPSCQLSKKTTKAQRPKPKAEDEDADKHLQANWRKSMAHHPRMQREERRENKQIPAYSWAILTIRPPPGWNARCRICRPLLPLAVTSHQRAEQACSEERRRPSCLHSQSQDSRPERAELRGLQLFLRSDPRPAGLALVGQWAIFACSAEQPAQQY